MIYLKTTTMIIFLLLIICKGCLMSYAFDEYNFNNYKHKIIFNTNYKELQLQYYHQIENNLYDSNNSNNVKINYERTGGLRGNTTSFAIDLDSLSISEREQINKLISNSDFFNLNSNTNSPGGAADFFTYTITIESDKNKHTVSVNDITLPNNLIPLIEFLDKKAMSLQNQ